MRGGACLRVFPKATTQNTQDIEHALVQIDEIATQVQRITSRLLLVGLDIET